MAMHRWHKYLAVTLLVILLAALGTSPIAAAAPKVNISVQTNFGSFKLSIAADTPEDKLAAVVSQQVWEQLGSALTGQYGSSLARALSDTLARQLVPAIKTILQRYAGVSPQPEPQPEPKPRPEPEPEPAPKPQPEPAPAGLTADEARMLELINRERQQRGLAPLEVDLAVTAEARKKSQDMIDKSYFGHISPTYGSPFQQLSRAGITYRAAGENLAGAPTVERAHTSLMNSAGHRANILNPSYTHVGIGIVDGGPYGKMFTQMFIQK